MTNVRLTVDILPDAYIDAVMTGNAYVQNEALRMFSSFLVNNTENHPAPEMFEHLVLPLLENDEEIRLHMDEEIDWARSTQGPILFGIAHPDCPPSVLHAACMSKNTIYGHYAARHASCPVEDAVFVALRDAELGYPS